MALASEELIPDYEAAVAAARAFAAEWQSRHLAQRAEAAARQESLLAARVLHIASRVYVGSITFDATKDDLLRLFSAAGPVKNIEMQLDPSTGRHRGFCFVEYEVADAAAAAIATLNGAMLVGRAIKVGRPTNYPADTPNGGLPLAPRERVYVANVHMAISERDLSAVFASFGQVLQCALSADPNNAQTHRGYGYVVFSKATAAQAVAAAMNGFNLAGLALVVMPATCGFPIEQLLAPATASFTIPAATPILTPAQAAAVAQAQATAASLAQQIT